MKYETHNSLLCLSIEGTQTLEDYVTHSQLVYRELLYIQYKFYLIFYLSSSQTGKSNRTSSAFLSIC